jgi:hypothetical protein
VCRVGSPHRKREVPEASATNTTSWSCILHGDAGLQGLGFRSGSAGSAPSTGSGRFQRPAPQTRPAGLASCTEMQGFRVYGLGFRHGSAGSAPHTGGGRCRRPGVPPPRPRTPVASCPLHRSSEAARKLFRCCSEAAHALHPLNPWPARGASLGPRITRIGNARLPHIVESLVALINGKVLSVFRVLDVGLRVQV